MEFLIYSLLLSFLFYGVIINLKSTNDKKVLFIKKRAKELRAKKIYWESKVLVFKVTELYPKSRNLFSS